MNPSLPFWCVLAVTSVLLLACSGPYPSFPDAPDEPRGNLVGYAINYESLGYSRPVAGGLDSQVVAFEDSSSSASLSVSASDDVVYRYGYRSIDGGSWGRFELAGDRRYGGWFLDNAGSSLSFTPDAFGLRPGGVAVDNYVLVFSCSYDDALQGWDCHGGRWQLLQFNASLSESCPDGCLHDGVCYRVGDFLGVIDSTCRDGGWVLLPDEPSEPGDSSLSGCSSDAECDDGNPCTSDSCDSGSCSNVALADGTKCLADGDACTYDRCEGGVCSHPLIPGCGEEECVSQASSACSGGDVYWYDSCGVREDVRFDCGSGESCVDGACVVDSGCSSHESSACLGGDVYWFDSCGAAEEVRYECGSGESCVDGSCVADSGVSGDVVYVSNPGDGNDIRPALEAAWDRASPGDTILLPAGSFSYSGSRVFAAYDKPGIHIKGAGSGPGGTRLYRTSETAEWMMSFYCTAGGRPPEAEVEVSDIWFQGMDTVVHEGDTGTDYPYFQGVAFRACDFYLHDCRFQYFSGRAVGISHPQDHGNGIVYNNEFTDNVAWRGGDDFSRGYAMNVGVWGEVTDWVDVEPGTDNFVFIEDNYFARQRPAVAGAQGALYVFRHNLRELSSSESAALDMHPAYPDWGWDYPYASRFTETYENTFIGVPEGHPLRVTNSPSAISFRGGGSVVHGNTFKDMPRSVRLWIGGAWWSSYYDYPDYYGGPEYPRPYQTGWESAINYGAGHSGTDPATYGAGDSFIWGNTYDNSGGVVVTSPVSFDGRSFDVLREGRDYHVGVPMPGYEPFEYPHPRRR